MKFVLLFTVSLIASFCAFLSDARADILRAYLLNPEMRYERGSSQDLEDRKPRNFSLGYQYTRWSGLLEYAQYKESSGNETYSADRTHQELLFWARFHAIGWTFGNGYNTLQVYGGVGGGSYQESVTTNFVGSSRSDTGSMKLITGLAAGSEYSVRLNEYFLLTAGLEGRALLTSDLDPSPMWSAVLRLGIGIFL